MVLSPRTTKTLRRHSRNDVVKSVPVNSALCRLGHYGLFLESSGQVKDRQHDAIKLLLRKSLKKQSKHWMTYTVQKTKTKKPNETRLGKGKGNVKHWYYSALSGSLLFEVSYLEATKVKLNVKNVARRVSFKTAL